MSITPDKPQYAKFEYKEFGDFLGQNVIVHTSANMMRNEADIEKDRIIHHVIEEHFAEDISTMMEYKNPAFDVPETVVTPETVIDIEAIKIERYKRGYDDAKASLEPEIARVKSDEAFSLLLSSKLESITPALDLEDQMFKLVSNLLNVIAKKLHLIVPADFESVILGEMVPLLNKYYKMGTITLNVNPDRVDYCKNLFRIGSLPHRISKNIVVAADESIAKDSCNMEWNDTLLEYNQEDLVLDVEKILEHLKIEINN